jgi:hypothetical protein
MPGPLVLTLVTGEPISLEVEDDQAGLKRFLSGDHEYTREWLRVDDEKLVWRDAIASARIGGARLNDLP